jgi:predicted transcriptional regulator
VPRTKYLQLSRRERQIMDILYREGRATAGRVQELIPEPPSYSTVRALLRVLEEKECVRHESAGREYVYVPTVAREKATQSALGHLVQTFFGGSTEAAVAALLKKEKLSRSELDRLAQMIDDAKKGETR